MVRLFLVTQKGLYRHSQKDFAELYYRERPKMEKNPKVMRVVSPFYSLNFAWEVVAVVACVQI